MRVTLYLFFCIVILTFNSCKTETKCNCDEDCTNSIKETEPEIRVLDRGNYLSEYDLIQESINQDSKNLKNFLENCPSLTNKERSKLLSGKIAKKTRVKLMEPCNKFLIDNIPETSSIKIRNPINPCSLWSECCPGYIAKNPSTVIRIVNQEDNTVLVDFDSLPSFNSIDSNLKFFDINKIKIAGINGPICKKKFTLEIITNSGFKTPFKLEINKKTNRKLMIL